jgi:caffeoyl-CoA O-methyltransferase
MNIIKDTEFNSSILDKLHTYSESENILSFNQEIQKLKNQLDSNKKLLNFPAVKDDVGSLLSFMSTLQQVKTVFEFGSGYGHSAFWYFLNNPNIEKVILTEKRNDLQEVFNNLSWPKAWLEKIEYHQADSFEVLKYVSNIDLFLVDGQKGDYLKFIDIAKEKLSANGVIAIDNAFWRGLFLDKDNTKSSAKKIGEMHQALKDDGSWNKTFLPFRDGVILLSKKSC